MNVSPATVYTAVLETGIPGLVDTIELGLLDNQGGYTDALSADDIIEFPAGSGIYTATRTAPDVAGDYTLLWSLDGSTDPDQVQIEELRVTSSRAAAGLPGARDLCELADVLRYVPGYESEPNTDDTLQALLTAESREWLKMREFVAIPDLAVRLFQIDAIAATRRVVAIGDCTQINGLEVQDENGVATATVDPADVLLLPLVRQEWEPIRAVQVPRATTALPPGRYLEVTGTWGFPSVPEDVRQAVAKRVLLRYLNDVAASGTAFADALNEGTVNLAALFSSARETMDSYLDRAIA